ncbi:hypothetical protein [Streptomyces sp. NPDC089799]|uniref:SCO2583 family membrane protein n=1 Tax=Streptomyces sp. NPDC089799 TaxID=3155066 RepID=UPI00342A0B3A
MAVPRDPYDATPDPFGGGEDDFRSDEYRSVVFDEDFVRAARLQEFSADERMGEHARAVRSRSVWSSGRSRTGTPGRAARQGLVLVLLIAMAFGAAVWMGLRNPYVAPRGNRTEELTSTIVPLAPSGQVPGGTSAGLLAHSPAERYRVGAAGITLPAVRRTPHFTDTQVVAALSIAKDYLVQSSLDPDVLAGEASRPVRILLDPDQLDQFDRSMGSTGGDPHLAATGWLVRFAPGTAVMADSRVRVKGTLAFDEVAPGVLEVISDHTFVYTVRPAAAGQAAGQTAGQTAGQAAGSDGASLFTVRRELRMRFDRDDLVARRAELLTAYVQAGPHDCAAEPYTGFRPLTAGTSATTTGPTATDPFADGRDRQAGGLCGVLATQGPTGAPQPQGPAGTQSTAGTQAPAGPGLAQAPAPAGSGPAGSDRAAAATPAAAVP